MTEQPPGGYQPDPRQFPQQPYPYQGPGGPQPQQYGPPAYGPPPGYGYPPPPRPPKKSNTGLIVLAVIGGICLVLFAGCGVLVALTGDNTNSPTVATVRQDETAPAVGDDQETEQPADESEDKTAGKVGTPVRDGKFQFTVKKVSRADSVGSGFTEQKPKGEFILIVITVENIGDEAQSFAGSVQKLIDADGREYEADTGAALWLKDSKSMYEQINPGLSVDGTVVFDVPKGLNPVAIELHDSLFSGGVRVSLK
ncbi:DUF4352 domain-containing protein [Microbispora bryophytorum]|uniref:Mpr protein n=1 Tax=Microbispora bryophytorum TaxID=1460882 RepID=A0A8H9H723_9ACTN|nr:DUF4352 domain-containing protein [Microbispora bryophytorum]MBD3139856.1 DUF4352 domain-containing protein [Microbispora bryophytorum]TQS02605.1 DUF4352 domain-containing protein [Microbispora bryophytorum]GGO26958.1 Mpr protein [Microbispora bryophytorum]